MINSMKKVIVIGCPGSGKSTFSTKLAKLTHLPLIHLDSLYHQEHWDSDQAVKKQQWSDTVTSLVKDDQWIIDGNYKSTMDIRIEAADTIIFLDYSRALCMWRTLVRRWQFRNKKRSDMPSSWKEKISYDFLKLIWNYNTEQRPNLIAELEKRSYQKEIHILKTPQDADNFLKKMAVGKA